MINFYWYDWKESINATNKNLNQAEEMAYIVLKVALQKVRQKEIFIRK